MIKVNKYAVFLHIMILSFISCKKDDGNGSNDSPTQTSLICLGEPSDTLVSNCDDSEVGLAGLYCEFIHYGQFSLTDNTLEFFSNYCNSVGDQLTYVKSNGESIGMILDSKYYYNSKIAQGHDKCVDTNLQNVWFCADVTRVTMRYKIPDWDMTLFINAEPVIEPFVSDIPPSGDVIDIRLITPSTNHTVFWALVDQGSLGNDWLYHDFFESIELGGETFNNVYYSNGYNYGNGHEHHYYVNKSHGLVAFRDTLGELWRID